MSALAKAWGWETRHQTHPQEGGCRRGQRCEVQAACWGEHHGPHLHVYMGTALLLLSLGAF